MLGDYEQAREEKDMEIRRLQVRIHDWLIAKLNMILHFADRRS